MKGQAIAVVLGALYRHHKGGLYRAIALARNTETQETLVVYAHAEGEFGTWARPAFGPAGWTTRVVWPDGIERERFVLDEATP